jgi:hypothetical protein
MKQFLIRDKFKTELGRKLFDILSQKTNDLNELYFAFTMIKGDEKKQILLNFLLKEDRTWDEIDDFIMTQWG